MKKQTWVLLSLASVLLIFCAVRDARSPAVSTGAPSAAPCEEGAQSDEKETGAGFEQALPSAGACNVNAANELHLRQLETAGKAQRVKQQEAVSELRRRQREGDPQRGPSPKGCCASGRWGPQAARTLS